MVKPLIALTDYATQIGEEKFAVVKPQMSHDELGLLGTTMHRMSTTLASMYKTLAQQVTEQTGALEQNHQQLEFLYTLSQRFQHSQPDQVQLRLLLKDLKQLVGVADLVLCLMTNTGDRPYLQLGVDMQIPRPCDAHDCQQCNLAMPVAVQTQDRVVWRFQLQREYQHFGTLLVQT